MTSLYTTIVFDSLEFISWCFFRMRSVGNIFLFVVFVHLTDIVWYRVCSLWLWYRVCSLWSSSVHCNIYNSQRNFQVCFIIINVPVCRAIIVYIMTAFIYTGALHKVYTHLLAQLCQLHKFILFSFQYSISLDQNKRLECSRMVQRLGSYN